MKIRPFSSQFLMMIPGNVFYSQCSFIPRSSLQWVYHDPAVAVNWIDRVIEDVSMTKRSYTSIGYLAYSLNLRQSDCQHFRKLTAAEAKPFSPKFLDALNSFPSDIEFLKGRVN